MRRPCIPSLARVAPLVLGLAAGVFAADAPTVQEIPGDDIVLWLEIPDLKTLVTHVETAGETFVKAAGEDESVVAQSLGQAIGPQELDALTPGMPVVLVVLKPKAGPQPDVAWFVPVKDAAVLTQAAARWRQQAVAAADDVLVLAQTAPAAERAKAALPSYRALAAAPAKADLRLHIGWSRALAQWGPMAKMGIESAAAMVGMADPKNGQATGAMVRLELNLALDLLGQLDASQADISTGKDGFALRWTNAAKAGSPLAACLAAQKDGANPAAALLPKAAPSAVAMSARYDAAALAALTTALFDQLAKDPTTKPLISPALTDSFTALVGAQDGDAAMRMAFGDDGVMRQTVVSTVHDAGALAAARTFVGAMFGGDSQIGKLYEGMGMTLAFQPEAREHAGVKVDQMRFTLDQTKMPPEQAATMSSFLGGMDIAVIGRWYVGATDAATTDALIDAATQAQPPAGGGLVTRAEQVHGAGAAVYIDYGIIDLFRGMLAKVPGAAAIPPGQHEPLTIAVRWKDGVAQNDVRVPYDTITTLIQAFSRHAAGGVDAAPAPAAPTF